MTCKILHLEDVAADAELVRQQLVDGGVEFELTRVSSRQDYQDAVKSGKFDLILSDFKLPDYDGGAALEFAKRAAPEVPFILVSGAIGEEMAVLSLLGGATDYILKEKPQRLASSVKRAVREAAERRKLKAVELEAAASRRDLENVRLALNNAGQVAITDTEGRLVYVNESFCRLSGYSASELIGKTHRVVNSGHHPKAFFKTLWETILAGKIFRADVCNRAKDGSLFWVATTITPFLDEKGKPYRFVVIRHDITARKRVEKELRESEENQRLAAEAAEIGLWHQDMVTGRVIETPLAMKFLGNEPLGAETFQEFLQRVHPDDRARVAAAHGRALAERAPYSVEFRRLDARGGQRWLAASGKAFYDASGRPTRVVGIVRDVTEAKAAARKLEETEAQLRQSQKMESIGRLAGGVAHDFNNLLTGIGGYAYFLLGSFPPEDPRRADVEEIRRGADRAAALTRQLLAFSRRQVLEPRVLDLGELVRNLEKMIGRLIGEQVRLVVAPSKERGLVKADPGQLEQLLMNLCINARDAMPKGGTLRVETGVARLKEEGPQSRVGVAPGDYVMLTVSDTGCGMDENVKAHLFEPFFTTKPQGKGTGLGLATVYGIVRQSGGFIFVSSEAGKGSRFEVVLPRATEEVTPAPPQDRVGTVGGSETILLVEDDETVRKFAARVLSESGYRVLAAASPEEALRIVEREPEIPLMLTDLIMPQMRGDELAERLTAARPRMKVIYMSGYSELTHVEAALRKGAPFLQKPMTPESLLARVRETLGPLAAAE